MSKEPNNIDRLVREKLDGFEMTPPPSVWENTSASLNSKKKRPFYLWFILGVAAVAALGTGIYFFSTQADKTEQLAVNDARNPIQAKSNSSEANEKNLNSKTNTSSFDKSSNSETEPGLNSADDDTNDSFGSDGNKNDDRTDGNRSSFDGNDSKKSTTDADRSRKDALLQGDSDNKFGSSGEKDSNNRFAFNGSKGSKDQRQKDASLKGDHSEGNSDGGDNIATADHSNSDSKKKRKDSADARDANGRGDDDTSDNSLNDRTDNQSLADKNKPNDLSNLKASPKAQDYGSLPLRPAEEFVGEQPSIVTDSIEDEPLPEITPFWKSLSIEGAVGVSTFRNQAKKSTPQSLLTTLNNVASAQQSIDFRFGLNYHFSERFSFQSGIHYNSSRENYRFDSEESYTYSVIDTISFSIDSVTMDTTFVLDSTIYDSTFIVANDLQNTYRIFTLPFHFAWSQSISPRGVLEFALGGEISILGRNTGLIIVDNSGFSFDAQSGYHTTGMLSVGGSIKYLHRFGDHHSAYIEPWAQFGVTNQSKPMISYESLRRRYGIRVGYRFYF
jgi:hypothetical protein